LRRLAILSCPSMSTETTSDARFRIGHVLFIDVVGYSKLLINEQTRLLHELNELVQGTEQFRTAEKKHRLVRIATGDGMALVFRDSPESPAQCALQISQALRSRALPFSIRMGIHCGPVSEVTDVNKHTNVAGAGINIAQRVMDCGDAGHILLSKHVAEDLEHHARWRPFLHDLGECQVKHGYRIALVNMYSPEAGNPRAPEKIRRIRKKQAASSILLYSITAALGVMIIGLSWFLSTRFSGAPVTTLKDVQSATPPPAGATPTAPAAEAPASTARAPAAPTTNVADWILSNGHPSNASWSESSPASPMPRPRKLFAGTWRGNIHNVGPKSTWDSAVELNIDETETHWSNMTGGSVSRDGKTLFYKRSYKLGSTTSVQVQATLMVQEDGRTATYTTSQVSVTGKSRSKTSGTGTLEKVD
jgi:class 3 adenylate cyclase